VALALACTAFMGLQAMKHFVQISAPKSSISPASGITPRNLIESWVQPCFGMLLGPNQSQTKRILHFSTPLRCTSRGVDNAWEGRGAAQIYPYTFLCTRPHKWTFLFSFGLFRPYIHGKQRLGPLYHEIGSGRPVAVVSMYRSRIYQVLIAHVCEVGHAQDLYIAFTNLPSHLYIYVRDTCKFSRDSVAPMVFIRRNPRLGGRRSTPIAFSVRGLTKDFFYFFWFV
jgi:hypothetical protein